jgi:hypothetical protein
MSHIDRGTRFRPLAYAGAAVLVVAYSWFATGTEPFHVLSYVLVALPVVIVFGLYAAVGTFDDERSGVSQYYRGRSLGASLSRSTPWLLVLLGAIILEMVGLLLGGRSPHVPTLSTLVDHLLRTHGLRWVLFVAWLAVGAAPLRRLSQHRHDRATP